MTATLEFNGLNDLYDTTCMTQVVWLLANSYKLMYKYLYQLLKNGMSYIFSNLYERNRPITFHVSQSCIILMKNLVKWIELKSGDLFLS